MLTGLHNQQYTPDSGDSQRPIFSTTIIAKYANNREDKACAPPPGEFKREEMEKEMETHTTLGARVLVNVEQGIFAAVASKKQMVSPRRLISRSEMLYC